MPLFLVRGFTLLELMVTLAVLSVLITIGIPSFQTSLDRHQAKTVAEAVRTAITEARAESLKRNIPVRTVIRPGAAWCIGLTDESTCDCSVGDSCSLDDRERVVRASNFRSSEIESSFASPATAFDARRGMPSQSGIITIKAKNGDILVTLNKLGRTSICSDAHYGYPAC